MNIDPALALHLLHRCALGTLATHARDPQGFPYPTVVPFAPDASHRPVILVSGLAEHTRNLAADPRAGFLVVDALDQAFYATFQNVEGLLTMMNVERRGVAWLDLGDACDDLHVGAGQIDALQLLSKRRVLSAG